MVLSLSTKTKNDKLRVRTLRVLIAIMMVLSTLSVLAILTTNVAATQLGPADLSIAVFGDSKKDAEPGDWVSFTLRITNSNTNNDGWVNLTVIGGTIFPDTNKNWQSSLEKDVDIVVKDSTYTDVRLDVRVGDEPFNSSSEAGHKERVEIKGEYYDKGDLTYTIAGTLQQIVDVEVLQKWKFDFTNKINESTTKKPTTARQVQFNFTINNTGNGEDTFTFKIENAPGNPFLPTEEVDPFMEETVQLTINNINKNTEAGIHFVIIKAYSENSSIAERQAGVNVQVDPTYNLDLSTGEPVTKNVEPDDEIIYNFTIENRGNDEDKVQISTGIIGSAPGWDVSNIYPGTTHTIFRNESSDLRIEISAPNNATYPTTVQTFINVSSQNDPTVYQYIDSIKTKITQISDVFVSGEDQRSLNDTTHQASFELNIENKGNGEDTFEFELYGNFPTGEFWNYNFNPPSITLGPKGQGSDKGTVYFNVTGPEDAAYRDFNLFINVTSEENPLVMEQKKITVSVGKSYNIDITRLASEKQSAFPGDTISVRIRGKNVGNFVDTFSLDIDKPAGAEWDAPFDPEIFQDLDPNSVAYTWLNLTVDENAQEGNYIFTIECYSSTDENKIDSAKLNISVKRKFEVELSVSSNSLNADPGSTVDFLFTVQNKGTGSCNVTMEPTMLAEFETYMNVKIEPASFELPTALSSRFVWVNITPSAANPLAPMNLSGIPISIDADITEKDGGPETTKEVKVKINQVYDVDVYISELYKNIEPGGTDFVMITVTNDGNGEDTFAISPTPPPSRPDWKVKADPTSTGFLAQDESKEIKINITVPGTESVVSDDVSIEVIPFGNKTKNMIENITIKVEETKDVRFVSTDNRKEVEPGSYVHFSVELENMGTVDDTFRLDIVVPPTSNLIDHELIALMDVDAKQRNSTTLNITVSDSDIDKLPDQDNITVEVKNSDNTVTVQRTYTIDITSVRGVRLASTTLEQKGKPKETLIYNISILNTGTGPDKFALNILPNPPYSQWAVLKNIGEYTSIMDPDETTFANVEVEIPTKRSPSPPFGKITILAESEENPEKNHTITLTIDVEQVFKLKVTAVATTQEVDPGENWTYQFNVKNDGTGIDTVELTVDKTEDTESIKSVSLDTYYLTLNPGETQPVFAKVTAVDEPEEGKLNPKVRITAESLNDTDDNPASDNDEVELEINPTVDIELEVDGDLKQDVVPNLSGTKVEVEYTVKVWNRGLGKDDFDIDEYNNHGFPVDISPTTTNKIDSGSSTTVTVKITIDNMARMSSIDYNTTLTVTSRTNTDKSEIITLKTRIKQAYGVELQVLDETIETEETFVGNNRIVTFLVDVENIGTGEDTFKLELSGTNANKATLSDSYYKLDSRDNQTLSVRVKIPRETAIGDIPITLKAISRGDDDKYDDSKDDASDEETLTVDVTQFYELKVDSTEQLLTGVPGDNIEFTISVNNRGNGEDTADIRRKNYDPDWSWTLSARRVDLGPIGDSDGTDVKEIKLSVDIPTDENGRSGYYNISIFVYSDTPDGLVIQNGGEPLLFTVKVDPIYDVDVILDYPSSTSDEDADPGDDIDYQITIKNRGNNLDTFTITVSGSRSSWVNLPEKTVQIEPYKSKVVSFTVEIPALTIDTEATKEIKADKYTITLKVTSEGDQDEFDELDIRPTVNKEYDIKMESDDVSLDIDETTGLITVDPEAEQNYERFTLSIKNLGNTIDTISLTTKTTDWKVKYDNQISKTLSLDIGVSRSVTVEISAPDKAKDGDSERLTITAKSADETTKTNFYVKATVETAVIKFGKLTQDGDTTVGSTITVTLQVRNDGNVDAEDIEVKFYDVDKSETIHTATIDEIGANSFEEISFTYKLEEGDHEIFAETPWAGDTEKKTGSAFSSETELFSMSNPLFWILIIIVLLVVFIVGAFIGSVRHSSGLPQDLRDEIAMAKQASKMGKSPEEINSMRRKKLDGGELGDRKKMGMKGDSEFRVNEEKEKPSKKESGKTTKIKCPNCDRIQTVTSTARPIEFPCSKCGMKLVLKK